jgi:hypothetical protein
MAEGWERQPLFPHKIFYTAGKLWGLPPKNFPGKKLSGLQRESKYVLLLNQLRNTFFLSNKWGTPNTVHVLQDDGTLTPLISLQ